jgi:hypothetical protein
MYELDYPDYISSLDEGVEFSKTISIGDSLSYDKCTDEHIKALKKAFNKNNLISLNVSGSTFLNTTTFNNSLYVSGRTIL